MLCKECVTIYYSVDEVCGSSVSLARYMEKRHSSLPGTGACICIHGCEIFVRAMKKVCVVLEYFECAHGLANILKLYYEVGCR